MRNPRVNGPAHLIATLIGVAYALVNFLLYDSLYHIAAGLLILCILTLSIKKRGER